jgi:hypothetical protein
MPTTIKTITSSQGGVKSYTNSYSSTFTGWTNVGTGATGSTTTTAAELPELTVGSALKVTNGGTGTGYVESPEFQIDAADLGVLLQISYKMITSTSVLYNAGDFQFQIWDSTTSNGSYAQNTTVSVVNVPADSTGGIFTPNFSQNPSRPFTKIRIVRSAGSSNAWASFSSITVTPGTIVQGAAVSEWQSFTPTGSWSTNTTYSGKYRRVGDSMELAYYLLLGGAPTSAPLTVNLPTGFTIDTTKLALASADNSEILGNVMIRDAGTANFVGSASYSTSSALAIKVYDDASGGVAYSQVTQTIPMTFASTDTVLIRAMVPIAEWAGNGTVNLGPGAQVQLFSSSTGTWDAAAAAGNTVAGYSTISGALTTTRSKVVRLPYAPQSISDVKLVFLPTGFTAPIGQEAWAPCTGTASFDWGAYISALSGTDVTVTFTQYRKMGSTFNSATGAINWASSDGQWALMVANPSSPVGFGLAGTDGSSGLYKAGQAPGSVSGSAIATGYIGEKVASVSTSFSAQSDATAKSAATLTLNKGVYNIYAVGVVSRAAGSINVYEIGLTISTSSSENPLTLANATAGRAVVLISPSAIFTISATKFQSLSHSLGGVVVASDSTPYYAVLNANGGTWDGNATFYAVRIA